MKDQIDEIMSACTNPKTPLIIEVPSAIFKWKQLDNLLKDMGYFVARVDQSILNDKTDLLFALDIACQFPDYFGFNWDALAESLSDFHWSKAKGFVLIIEKLGNLNDKDLKVFLGIMEEASGKWANQNISFKLLIPEDAFPAKVRSS